jgi:sulfur-carrier protein
VRVLIPSPLFSYTGGRAEVDATGSTLAELLVDLDRRFPGLRFRVVDEHGAIRPHVRMWVGARMATDLGAAVSPDEVVMLVAALSGG